MAGSGEIQLETRAFNLTRPPSMLTVYSTSRPPLSFSSLVFCWTKRSKSFRLGAFALSPVSRARLDQLFVERVHLFLFVLRVDRDMANAAGSCGRRCSTARRRSRWSRRRRDGSRAGFERCFPGALGFDGLGGRAEMVLCGCRLLSASSSCATCPDTWRRSGSSC